MSHSHIYHHVCSILPLEWVCVSHHTFQTEDMYVHVYTHMKIPYSQLQIHTHFCMKYWVVEAWREQVLLY